LDLAELCLADVASSSTVVLQLTVDRLWFGIVSTHQTEYTVCFSAVRHDDFVDRYDDVDRKLHSADASFRCCRFADWSGIGCEWM